MKYYLLEPVTYFLVGVVFKYCSHLPELYVFFEVTINLILFRSLCFLYTSSRELAGPKLVISGISVLQIKATDASYLYTPAYIRMILYFR